MSFTINLDSQENMTKAELFTKPLRAVLGGREFTNMNQKEGNGVEKELQAIYNIWQKALIGLLLLTLALPYTIIAAAILIAPPICKAIFDCFSTPIRPDDDLDKILEEELKQPIGEEKLNEELIQSISEEEKDRISSSSSSNSTETIRSKSSSSSSEELKKSHSEEDLNLKNSSINEGIKEVKSEIKT